MDHGGVNGGISGRRDRRYNNPLLFTASRIVMGGARGVFEDQLREKVELTSSEDPTILMICNSSHLNTCYCS
jgi:hypothetical protein